MAATITGTFILIDRATDTMKKMERQARKTQAAIQGVGGKLDKTSASGKKSNTTLDGTARQMRNVQTEADRAGRSVENFGRSHDRAAQKQNLLMRGLDALGGKLLRFGTVMTGLKFGGLATGITALVQGVGALAGGFIALLPAVGQASGALLALPTIVASVLQGFGVLKLAFMGVSKAIQAGIAVQTQSSQAVMQLRDQQLSAANALIGAEHSVQIAQRTSKQAQIELTIARREAKREIEDLAFASKNAALQQQRAALSLSEAKQQLALSMVTPGTTMLQLQDLRLGVKEAQLASKQSRVTSSRARADAGRAARHDPTSSPTQRLTQAQNSLADATYGVQEAQRSLAQTQRQFRLAMSQGTAATQQFRQAMKNLSPGAQAFVKRIVSLRPAFRQLTAAAGQRLWPQMQRGVTNLTRAFPALEKVARRTGGVIGKSFANFTQRAFTGRGLRDFTSVANENTRVIGRMGAGMTHIWMGLQNIMIAAKPFTEWLTKTILGWTSWFEHTTRVNRENGKLAAFLDKTKHALQLFGDILKNLGQAFMGVMHAAEPLGNRLWSGFDQAARGWNAFANSVEGQSKLQAGFNKLYAPLHQLGQLTKSLIEGWARITVNGNFAETIEHLRRAGPAIEKLFMSASGLGPAFADLLGTIAKTLSDLPSSSITLLVRMLDKLLQVIDLLMRKIPGFGYLVNAVLLTAMGVKLLNVIGKVKALAGVWDAVKIAALGAAGAQGTATELSTVAAGLGPGALARREAAGAAEQGLGTSLLARGARRVGGEGGLIGRAGGLLGRAGGFFGFPGLGARAGGILGGVAGFGSKLLRGGLIGGGLALGGQMLGGLVGGRGGATLAGAGTGAGIGATVGSVVPILGTGLGALAGGAIGGLVGFFGHKGPSALDKFKSTADKTFADLQAQGNAGALDKLANQAANFAKNTKNGGQQLADFALRARTAAQQIRDLQLFQNMRFQMLGMTKITKTGTSQIINELGQMSPKARDRAYHMLLSMSKQMERSGIIPVGSTTHLRNLILAKLDGLSPGAKHRTDKMLKTMDREIQDAAQLAPNLTDFFGVLFGLGFKPFTAVPGQNAPKGQQIPGVTIPPGGIPGFTPTQGAQQGRNLRRLEHPKRPHHRAAGGPVYGAGHSDTVPAMLTPGEFVMRRSAVSRHGLGTMYAMNAGMAVGGVAGGVHSLRGDGSKSIDQATTDWHHRMQRGLRRVKQPVDDFHNHTIKSWADTRSKVNNTTQGVLSDSKDDQRGWPAIQNQVSRSASKAYNDTANAFDGIRQKAIKVLVSMGYSRSDATNYVQAGKGKKKAAAGMRIPGVGLHDTVPVFAGGGHIATAAPGELIVNRHTEHRVNRALGMFGTSLGREVAGETRPHYMAKGSRVQGAGSSGYVFPFPSGEKVSWARIDQGQDLQGPPGGKILAIAPGDVSVAHDRFGGFGPFYPTENITAGPLKGRSIYYGHAKDTRTGHVAAGDVIGVTQSRANTWTAAPAGWLELGFLPYGSMTAGRAIAPILRQIAGNRAVGAGGAGTFSLKSPKPTVGGVAGAMQAKALQAMTTGLVDHVNKKIGAATGGGNYTGPLNRTFPQNGKDTLSSGQVKQLARAAGFTGKMVALMDHVTYAESNRQPGQVNSIGATGLTQILLSAHPDAGGSAAMRNPWRNMQYAHHLFTSAGNSLIDWAASKNAGAGGGWGKYAALGRRVGDAGWFARPGSFTTHGPTVFGAGEEGTETVTVHRGGQGTGRGGHSFHIEIHKVEMHRRGDLKKAVKEEIDDLAKELELMP